MRYFSKVSIGLMLFMMLIMAVFLCSIDGAMKCQDKALGIENFYQHCKVVVGTMVLQSKAARGQRWILSDADKVKNYCACLCQSYTVEAVADDRCLVHDSGVEFAVKQDKVKLICLSHRPW